jgi:hypothetical protein
MLHLLSNALREVQTKHGEQQLRLAFYNLGSDSRLEVTETSQNVAGDLEISGAEAIGLLNELGEDGYLRLNYGSGGRYAGAGLVMIDITDKGRAEMQRAIPASQEELWAIKHRLQQRQFDTALNHLNQAESAFDRREWESANAQIRSCLEEVFDRVAEIKLGTNKTGELARKELQEKGFLSKHEADLVKAFMAVAGGAGSHPGMSSEDEARGRFLAGLGICYIGLSLLS